MAPSTCWAPTWPGPWSPHLPRGHLGFWGGVVGAALGWSAWSGVVVEMLLLRRIYRAPELFQLLATFGVVLIVQDLSLLTWGRTGPARAARAGAAWRHGDPRPALPGLRPVPDRRRTGGCCWPCSALFHRTRWGTLVRAATLDREMVGALGVNQRMLFTSVFFLGSVPCWSWPARCNCRGKA